MATKRVSNGNSAARIGRFTMLKKVRWGESRAIICKQWDNKMSERKEIYDIIQHIRLRSAPLKTQRGGVGSGKSRRKNNQAGSVLARDGESGPLGSVCRWNPWGKELVVLRRSGA